MKRKWLLFAVIGLCKVLILSCVSAEASRWDAGREQVGWASWYGGRFHGRETASGERFSKMELTAAHRSIPLGTKVLVTNLETDEVVEVKINDRGPMPKERIIDLSRAAAETIGLLHRGVGEVSVVVSEKPLTLQDTNDDIDYEVQVGAFVDIEAAKDLWHQLQGRFPSAHITTRDGPLGSYHRVRLGPFASRAEAQDALDTLERDGYHAFLDEVAANASRGPRLTMPNDKKSHDVEPESHDPGDSDLQEGMAMSSFAKE